MLPTANAQLGLFNSMRTARGGNSLLTLSHEEEEMH